MRTITLRHLMVAMLLVAVVCFLATLMKRPHFEVTKNTSSMTKADISLENFSGFSCSFGNAAEYYQEFRISRSGAIVYLTMDHTGRTPVYLRSQTVLSDRDLLGLIEILRQENFEELPDFYDTGVTDVSVISLTLKSNGRLKTTGCNDVVNPPRAIGGIFAYIFNDVLSRYSSDLANQVPITWDEVVELPSAPLSPISPQ
ncbi:hypothetical protein [Bremerella sp.]|uniref:hypothetical protein n=1 Tax=Bremerella sp. TaxID=2795602 RepID=UPI00391D3A77